MIRETITVTNPKGIHARPSSMIVQTAGAASSSITFTYQGVTVNAADIMGVLSLGAAHGAEIIVEVSGDDEAAAMARMKEIFALNFNDE